MTSGRKLLLLGALYLAQGLPYGFFTQALPVLLRERDVSLEHIGLSTLLALPWALKFAWAPVVDRVGTRRRWILTLQAVAALLAVVLAAAEPDVGAGLWVLLGAVLLTNQVAATQDIATDSLAVSLLNPSERGLGNGVQVAGYRVGMILGGGLLLVVFDIAGWAPTLLGMGLMIALASGPLLATPAAGATASRSCGEEATGNPWSWLQRPGVAGWVAVLVAFKVGDYMAGGMLRPWMVDAGMTKTDIGLMLGTGGFTAGLLGALLGGALVNPLGRHRALVLFALLQCTGLVGYSICVAGDLTGLPLWGAVIWEHAVGGMATAALFTLMMDASRPEHAATDYTLQACVVVIAAAVGATASGFGAAQLGYAGLFILASGCSVAAPMMAAIPALTAVTRAGPEPVPLSR